MESFARNREMSSVGRGRSPTLSEPDVFPLTLGKSAAMRVTHAARQSDGLGEIHSHFGYRMRVRRESDRHAFAISHLNDSWARVNLFAILAQSGGIEFHCEAIFLYGFQKFADQRRDVLVRIETELLAQ